MDSAYDSSDVRFILLESKITPVIAVNERGHYSSETPKGHDYKKRGAIERFFSSLKRRLNPLNVRVNGPRRVTIHVNNCIFGYLMKYIL